jgi:hypothetical protein
MPTSVANNAEVVLLFPYSGLSAQRTFISKPPQQSDEHNSFEYPRWTRTLTAEEVVNAPESAQVYWAAATGSVPS